MSLFSFHTLSAFIDEYKLRNTSTKRKMNASFEVGIRGSESIASFQFSYLHNNSHYMFYSEIPLGPTENDKIVKEELKRVSILFNIIRTWLESMQIPIAPVRVDQKVNGIINYKEFHEKALKVYQETFNEVPPVGTE